MKKMAFLLFAFGLVAVGWGQPVESGSSHLDLIAGPPQPVSQITGTVVGNGGNGTVYYWVVATYTRGNAIAGGPAQVNGVGNLSASNYVRVSWNGLPGAIGYDVLKTLTPTLPSGVCTCYLTSTTTLTSANDIGGALIAYPLTAVGQAPFSLAINNQSYAYPTLQFVFPDGLVTLDHTGFGGSGVVTGPAHGGTGVASPTAHGVAVAEGANPFVFAAPGTLGWVLTSNGPTIDPTFQAISTGTSVSVNGSSVSNPNFNATAPTADAGYLTLAWKVAASNVITEAPYANTSTDGVLSQADWNRFDAASASAGASASSFFEDDYTNIVPLLAGQNVQEVNSLLRMPKLGGSGCGRNKPKLEHSAWRGVSL